MTDMTDRIAAVLREDGWTCEYHEPVSGPGECSQCDDAHRRTAVRIEAAIDGMHHDPYTHPVTEAEWDDWTARHR